MAETCQKCGLPRDICICEEIAKEHEKIVIRIETRKWDKVATIAEGFQKGRSELIEIASILKSRCACGGGVKGNSIILQGDHREKVRELLTELGFSEENIEVR